MENASELDNQIIESPSNRLYNLSGTGEMSINGNLTLSGVYSGKLNVSQCLVVGKEGLVIGEIRVKDLKVYGKMIGKVYVSNVVELHENSQISGRLVAKELKMHSGSKINGGRDVEKITSYVNKNNRYESINAGSLAKHAVAGVGDHRI